MQAGGLLLGQYPVIQAPFRPPPPAPSAFKSPAIPTTTFSLHLEAGDARARNRVSAEVIDSSHWENSAAFSVNGAEPESWRVSETCKQSTAELSGQSQTHWRVSKRETVEQIIVLLERKGVNNISAQELAGCRRWW